MSFNPNMSLEEFIKLAEKFADEQYGSSVTAENSENLIYGADSLLAEAEERKERMLRKNYLLANNGWDLTNATMDVIRQKVHTAGNIQVGRFIVKIRNYKSDKETTTVNLDIHEEKLMKGAFAPMKIPQRVNVIKDMRFEGRPWLKYFTNNIAGGVSIPIKTAADIVRWCQAVHRMGAFI